MASALFKWSITLCFLFTCWSAYPQYHHVNVSSTLNVRTQPSTSSEVKAVLSNGQKVYVIDEKDGWAGIIYNDTETGYVKASYLKKAEDTSAAAQRKPKWYDVFITWKGFFALIMIALVALIYRIYNEAGEHSEITLIGMGVLVLYQTGYFLWWHFVAEDDPFWFTNPHVVGFFPGILSSFVLYLMIYAQLVFAMGFISDDEVINSTPVRVMGVVTGAVAFLFGIPFFDFSGAIMPAIIILGAIHLIFVVRYIIVGDSSYNKFGIGITYLCTMFSTGILIANIPSRFMYIIDYIAS